MNQERPDLYELSALISRQAEIVEKLADSTPSPGHPTLEDRIERLERRQKLLIDGLIVSLTASRRLFSTSALYTVASKRFLLEQGNLTDEELAYHAPFFEMADSVGEMVGAMDTVISATQRLREVDEDIEEPPAATENS